MEIYQFVPRDNPSFLIMYYSHKKYQKIEKQQGKKDVKKKEKKNNNKERYSQSTGEERLEKRKKIFSKDTSIEQSESYTKHSKSSLQRTTDKADKSSCREETKDKKDDK